MEKSAGRSAAPQGRIVVALTVLALARLYIADPPAFRPSSARARGRGTACRNCALAEPDQRGQAGDDPDGDGACPSWKLQVSALVAVAFCKARRFCFAFPVRPPPRRGTT